MSTMNPIRKRQGDTCRVTIFHLALVAATFVSVTMVLLTWLCVLEL